jgi:hypothetical protein
MLSRAVPLAPRSGYPFFTLTVGGLTWVARVPPLPGSRMDLLSWYGEQVRQAQADTEAAAACVETEPDRARALYAAANRRSVGAVGWVLLTTWRDPTTALDAEDGWRRGDFKGMDAKIDAGCAAADEIAESASLVFRELVSAAGAILGACSGQEPDSTDVAEVKSFSAPPTDG